MLIIIFTNIVDFNKFNYLMSFKIKKKVVKKFNKNNQNRDLIIKVELPRP